MSSSNNHSTSIFYDDDDEDFDLCGIAQGDTRFASALKSPFCPKVGACGHSFTDQSLKHWFQVRKEEEYHKTTKFLPCPYKCTEIEKGKRGSILQKEIQAFDPKRLVPNYSLCQAIQVIRHAQRNKKPTSAIKKAAAALDLCSQCENKYTIESKSKHSPIVGLCGHTVCLQCLTKVAKAQRRNVKNFACPVCMEKKTFCKDRFVENIDFEKSLRYYWKSICPVDVLVEKPAAAKVTDQKVPVQEAFPSACSTKQVIAKKRKPATRKKTAKRTRATEDIDSDLVTPRPTKRTRRGAAY